MLTSPSIIKHNMIGRIVKFSCEYIQYCLIDTSFFFHWNLLMWHSCSVLRPLYLIRELLFLLYWSDAFI